MAAGKSFFANRGFPLLNFSGVLKGGYCAGNFFVDENGKFVAENLCTVELDNLAEHFREPGRLPWDQRDLTHPGDDDNHE